MSNRYKSNQILFANKRAFKKSILRNNRSEVQLPQPKKTQKAEDDH